MYNNKVIRTIDFGSILINFCWLKLGSRMSRNSDKANTVLFRYQEQKAEEAGYIDYNSTARPRSVQKVTNLKDAENWRKQVLKEISQKVTKIQDQQLSSYQIRDLNDEINKLMREKYAWEYHIKEKLNGTDYLKSGSRFQEGGVLIRGYRYFGRAKELPGVKEILEKQQQDLKDKRTFQENAKSQKQKINELESRVDLHYYGYFDEKKRDNRSEFAGKVWEEVNEVLGDNISVPNLDQGEQVQEILKDELLKFERSATRKRSKKLASIQDPKEILIVEDSEPPSQKQVEAYLVERRRKQLAEKYDI